MPSKQKSRFVCGDIVVAMQLFLCSLAVVSCNFYDRAHPLAKYDNKQPSIFEDGLISTSKNHEALSYISPEKDLIIFTRSSSDFSESTLYLSNYENEKWTAPRKMEFESGNYQAGFTLGPNGQKGYFTNKLAITGRDSTDTWNIWEVEMGKNFEIIAPSARPLDSAVNSTAKDCCLTMNANGDVYFSSDRDGSWDIYSAAYVNGDFMNIEKLNSPINLDKTGEWPSYIHEDGSYLMFSSIRKSGVGGDDIYVSSKLKNRWQTPILLDSLINTESYEDSARLVDNGQYLFFSSWRSDSGATRTSNIYVLPNPKLLEH